MPLYGMITRVRRGNEVAWVFTGPGPTPQSDSNLLKLLNHLGQENWEVVGVGDFGSVGGEQADEIILKK